MRTRTKIGRTLLLLMVCGLLLPPVLSAEESGDFAVAFKAFAVCEPCLVNADCDSGNCGVNVGNPADKRCIPAGAATYECTDDSSG